MYRIAVEFVIAGLLVTSVLAVNPPYKMMKESQTPPHETSPAVVGQLYQVLQDIHDLFMAANLTYVISEGTLLGAVRDGGLIPWDSDVDIKVPQQDDERLRSLKPVIENSMGYRFKPFMFGYKVLVFPGQDFPFLDIFMFDINDLGEEYNTRDKTFSFCHFNLEELYPRKLYKFDTLELYGPHQAEPMLDRCYNGLGGDWRKVAYAESDDHRSMTPISRRYTSNWRHAKSPIPILKHRYDFPKLFSLYNVTVTPALPQFSSHYVPAPVKPLSGSALNFGSSGSD